jgi:hypothetical protein
MYKTVIKISKYGKKGENDHDGFLLYPTTLFVLKGFSVDLHLQMR